MGVRRVSVERAKALRQKLTDPEALLWVRLRERFEDSPVFRRQHPMGSYILDFYCAAARLAVEIDGHSYGEPEQAAQDRRRDAWLESRGVTVYRTFASTVMTDSAQVADAVRLVADALIAERRAAPSTALTGGPPPPLHGGGRDFSEQTSRPACGEGGPRPEEGVVGGMAL